MFTTSTSLHSSTQLPIIVEMINRTSIGANEGGQQPSEMEYLAKWETPRAQMPPSTRFSPKYLATPAGNAHILTGSVPQTESDVSYRKQRTEYFLTGARMHFRETRFPSRARRFRLATRPVLLARSSRRSTSKACVVQSYFGAQ